MKPINKHSLLASAMHIPFPRFFLFLFAAMISLTLACQKESVVKMETKKNKKTVLDHVLDLENMYLIKYHFQYNEHYQVTHIFRGERYAASNQLQLIAEAFYKKNNKQELPDSLVTYNSKGFTVGVIRTDQFRKLAATPNTNQYIWPERPNKLLSTPGGKLALAIAGIKVNWSGAGHLGSGAEVQIMNNLSYINRTSLKDSLQSPIKNKTDGTDRKFDDYLIQYNKMGYPVDLSFYDEINAGFESAKLSYREE